MMRSTLLLAILLFCAGVLVAPVAADAPYMNTFLNGGDHDQVQKAQGIPAGSGSAAESYGVFRGGTWYIKDDADPRGYRDFGFGMGTDIPVVVDGAIGVFRDGTWYIEDEVDPRGYRDFSFGIGTDIPVVVDGAIGVFRDGTWYIEDEIDPRGYRDFSFGMGTDIPVVVDGAIGVFRDGTWYIEDEADPQGFRDFIFGTAGDVPVVVPVETPYELTVIRVEAIQENVVVVEFEPSDEPREDVTLEVIDPDGTIHPIRPQYISDGQTMDEFWFVTQLDEVMAGTWYVNGVPYNKVVESGTIDSVDLAVREGSIEYGYTFKDGDVVVTWDTALSEEYMLDPDASYVRLYRHGEEVGDEVSLATLGVDPAEEESGTTTFPDFVGMAAEFGIEIDLDDPDTLEYIPTDVKVHVTSSDEAEEPWSVTTTESIPGTMIPDGDYNVARDMNNYLYTNEIVNQYYDEGASMMATSGIEGVPRVRAHATVASNPMRASSILDSVPTEYTEPLPADGWIPAPPGACPAAAEPKVRFVTQGGDPVTPETLDPIEAIPAAMIIAEEGGLMAEMEAMVDLTDEDIQQDLMTPEGWNTHLWDEVAGLQEPAESLLDYHMWLVGGDIESDAVARYRESLVAHEVPEDIITAFDESASSGWLANTQPEESDTFAGMEIEAVMTGSVTGTVYEERAFTIPGGGATPEWGVQTGRGEIMFTHPDLGEMEFDVDIWLDEFDEQGRAIGGEVTADGIDDHAGYTVRFIFKPDGTKDGELYYDGELVGEMTMDVDAEAFENYVNVKTGETKELPPVEKP